mmetsp:Transcript_52489/g.170478  ORF Transcript_52489/g.170478 Transcript_52489/m.170478 type:complete len:430 (-) Transcript_52489:224-1513(-)
MTGLEEAFALGTPTQAAVAAAPRVASLALLARVEGGAGVLGQVARSPPPQRSGAAGAAVALCGVVCLAAVGKAARRRRSKVAAAAGTPGDKLSLFSPAKVNLFLRIIRRREDGYHDLASLFHTVSFGDTLDLEVLPEEAAKDELQCNLPGVPVDDSNLVIRALNLFRKMSGEKNYFRINLQKSIPAQAGMGGGSSNAATAFYGANALCGRPASAEELIKWADDPVIGSDATFFLSEGTAYCTGRGEIVTPVAPLSVPADLPVFLVKPRMGLSTPRVFKALDLSMLSKVEPEVLLKTFQEKGADHETDLVSDYWGNANRRTDLPPQGFFVKRIPGLGERPRAAGLRCGTRPRQAQGFLGEGWRLRFPLRAHVRLGLHDLRDRRAEGRRRGLREGHARRLRHRRHLALRPRAAKRLRVMVQLPRGQELSMP